MTGHIHLVDRMWFLQLHRIGKGRRGGTEEECESATVLPIQGIGTKHREVLICGSPT